LTERADDAARRAVADAIAGERLRIVAALIRTTGDWDLAEDALADASERALERWSRDGIPDNPAAWLTTTARRRAIDVLRRRGTERAKLAELTMADDATGEKAELGPYDDDRLRLVFTCCHPALSMQARVALTLKVVSSLPTAAIARAFLTTEATMSQRLLRAKRRIAEAGIPYRVPPPDALAERLDGVLAVVYLVFTEGYTTSDADVALEAIRLGRLVVDLMPDADEARALLALMLLQSSRHAARVVDGELVTLEEQDRSRWDRGAIDEALALLTAPTGPRRPYRIQADLAAVHAIAPDPAATDWLRIVTLYDELMDIYPSPVVELNRAIAVGMSDGPLAGLRELDAVADQLGDLYVVPAARGELLARAGRTDAARDELARAIALAPSEPVRRQLRRRRDRLDDARE
jgi:RNA polymerase sigma-70 factor (ECF subfamily)